MVESDPNDSSDDDYQDIPQMPLRQHDNEAGVDVSPPIACHGVTRDSMFGLQCMRSSTVNAGDSRFILVRALNCSRVIALRPVSVSLCVGLIVCCCVVEVMISRL